MTAAMGNGSIWLIADCQYARKITDAIEWGARELSCLTISGPFRPGRSGPNGHACLDVFLLVTRPIRNSSSTSRSKQPSGCQAMGSPAKRAHEAGCGCLLSLGARSFVVSHCDDLFRPAQVSILGGAYISLDRGWEDEARWRPSGLRSGRWLASWATGEK